MFERALRAIQNKLTGIEQALQDALSGNDMTVYAAQLSSQARSNQQQQGPELQSNIFIPNNQPSYTRIEQKQGKKETFELNYYNIQNSFMSRFK